MDVISDEIGRGPPHAMLFVDDLVICEDTRTSSRAAGIVEKGNRV